MDRKMLTFFLLNMILGLLVCFSNVFVFFIPGNFFLYIFVVMRVIVGIIKAFPHVIYTINFVLFNVKILLCSVISTIQCILV